jgi:hypothetical protein
MQIKQKYLSLFLFLLLFQFSFPSKIHTQRHHRRFSEQRNLNWCQCHHPRAQTGVTNQRIRILFDHRTQRTYTVQISFVGYQTVEQSIALDKNTKLNYKLSGEQEQLEEVVITDNRKATNIRKAEMSVNKLSIQSIKKMPVVMGEVDVLKSILLLPGVTNAGEGASGFNVRGGGADQNLILLDEANIFNSSHVFGFFSVFNPDAIKD